MGIEMALALIPVLVSAVMKIIEGVRASGKLTDDQKMALQELSDRLDETNRQVQAVIIRDV